MHSLTELPIADLRSAGDAIETVIDFRDYLPPGGILVTLAGKFRDDIRDELGMKRLECVDRGGGKKPLSDLPGPEFWRLLTAVRALLGRYTPFMDDPELFILLSELDERLRVQTQERARGARRSAAEVAREEVIA